jgi:putative transposase
MDGLIFNAALRLDGEGFQGFYRVIAIASGGIAWLAYVGGWQLAETEDKKEPAKGGVQSVAVAALLAMEKAGQACSIDLSPAPRLMQLAEDLDAKDLALWHWREKAAQPMLDPERIYFSLMSKGGLGLVIQECCATSGCSRPMAYKLWALLCVHGFSRLSLMPRFDSCGAPGVLRPMRSDTQKAGRKTARQLVGEPEPFPQRGIVEDDRVKILHHYRRLARTGQTANSLYQQIIEAAYVTRYRAEGDVRLPVLPPQGSFPNQRQVRYVIESSVKKLERVLRRTTEGNYKRNLRGIVGRSFDGVAGPGITYAIDSTIGDVYLRSSVNRAWVVGRPILYIIVDVWSTAVVGFYVCLSGPSWNAAKVALFSTVCDPSLLGDLWGYEPIQTLYPRPRVPRNLLCDRGEYLSLLANETYRSLNINAQYAPAYRPDLKGIVEVMHRIAKDRQYEFVPGAIDARRRELELKKDARESAMTMREYVQYLTGVFAEYNLFANREHRMTSEMIAAGIEPSPAGLWRFGFEAGLGGGRYESQEFFITNLLPRHKAVARRDGIFLDSLQYEGEVARAQEWTAAARNFGVIEQTAYAFPGSKSRFWWPNPAGGLEVFRLRPNARTVPETTTDEWHDALMVESMKRGDRQYRRVLAALEKLAKDRALIKGAVERTRAADEGVKASQTPNAREARALEVLVGQHTEVASLSEDASAPTDVGQLSEEYEAVMTSMFEEMNRDGDA